MTESDAASSNPKDINLRALSQRSIDWLFSADPYAARSLQYGHVGGAAHAGQCGRHAVVGLHRFGAAAGDGVVVGGGGGVA